MTTDGQDDLEFRDLDDGATTVVVIREECLGDETAAPLKSRLKDEISRRIESGRTSFVLNLGGVVMVDSCGLAAIISLKRMLDQAGASLALTDLSELLERLFHLTRLDRVIEIHATEVDALALP